MRFQMTKARHIEVWQNLPFSMHNHKEAISLKIPSYGNISTLFHGLFKIFAHEKNNNTENEEAVIENAPDSNIDETSSLRHLENCANAARKTEGYGQYE